jgi:hypothetical protein
MIAEAAKSPANLLGIQWQVTSNVSADTDAGVGCPVDVTVTKIKFLP